MFDYFVAALRCPDCGHVSAPTAITNMQTHIRSDADGSEIAVGYVLDSVDLTTESILGSGYALITPPPHEGTMRLLNTWICPANQTEQWAAIDIVDYRIERIEAVTLNRATLASANFISDINADILAESLSDSSISQRNLSSVEVLRQRLP